MLTKIKCAILVGSLLSTLGVASPALAASHLETGAQPYQGAIINGFPAEQWEQSAPRAFVGGA